MIGALRNPDFFPALIKVIDGAKRSITIVNYLAQFSAEKDPTDPMRKIADALASAVLRGATVSVFLEGSKFEMNYPFYRYLKDRKIDAWLDTSKTFIHEKVVLADDSLMIAGSHNLSRASFELSEEFSIMTDDKGAIDTFCAGLKNISSQRDEIKEGKNADAIVLPPDFISKVIRPLYRAHAEAAFNLYMLLWFEDGGAMRPIAIEVEKWGKELGYSVENAGKDVSKKYRRHYFEQRVNKILGQLEKAGLITVDRTSDTVSLTQWEQTPGFKIPKPFWTDLWLTKLSFKAKYFWFISLAELMDSPFYPWWSLSVREIAKKYGCDAGVVKGALELSSFGILEILRGTPVKRGNSYSEEAQYYRINPLNNLAKPTNSYSYTPVTSIKGARIFKRP